MKSKNIGGDLEKKNWKSMQDAKQNNNGMTDLNVNFDGEFLQKSSSAASNVQAISPTTTASNQVHTKDHNAISSNLN